ncbi:MAG: ribonuclease R [Cyanobacteriota bacterium]|nr:ribonuclease R [Cyanobacteriota bacterium]
MEFSVPQLFERFFATSSADSPIDLATLQEQLGITHTEQHLELAIALDGLIQVGFIEAVGDNAYRRKSDDSLVVGRLRCSSKGFCFAIRDEPGVEDIYIHASNLHGAWNGDQVLMRITKDGNRKRSPEGEVAAVIERANPTIVGEIKRGEQGFRAKPLDDRLLFELELVEDPATTDIPNLQDGQFAYIEINRYPLANLLPLGSVRKVLGSNPETSIDIDLVCCKYDLPQQFSADLLATVADLPQKISKTELKNRQDYRDWLVVTIEPLDLQHPQAFVPNAGISLQSEGEGWLLGVHISDLAHWIPGDHPLAKEAQRRCQVVYLDPAILPLFPAELHQQYGLFPQQERLSLSVLLHLTPEGNLQGFEIYPSVVKTRAHLTYEQVEALLVPPEESSEPAGELMTLLGNLRQLSQHLRQQRHRAQGFDLPFSDIYPPHAADDHRVGVPLISPSRPAHAWMVEPLLLANRAVGEHLHRLGIPFLAEVQPAPSPEAMQSFLRLATNLNLSGSVLTDAGQVTLGDFQQLAASISHPEVVATGSSPALTAQLLATLPPIRYQWQPQDPTAEMGHFGLSLAGGLGRITAPFRSYGDLVNQRSLHLLFDKGRDRRTPRAKKDVVNLHSSQCYTQIDWPILEDEVVAEWRAYLQQQLDLLNPQWQRVQQAEQELTGLKKSEFMQKHLGETFPGLIIGVQNYGFFVQVDPILAEGLVHVSSLKNDWYEYRSRQQALVGRKARKQFRLGDRVEVQIKNVDYYRQQIDLVVIGEGRFYDEEES